MQRKYIFLSGFFALLSLTALSLAGLTGDTPFCYIRDRFGRTVNLKGLCQQQRVSSSSEENPLTVREVDQNGSVILQDGTVVMNDGFSFRPVYQDGQIVQVDLIRPDGSVAQPGENFVLPDGRVIRLPPSGESGIGIGVWLWDN